MCHLYQSVTKAKKLRKLRLTLLRSKVKKKTFFTLFVCGEGGITNPLKTPARQVQDYIGGRGTFALKRGQKLNSPKLVLFHKCFSAQRSLPADVLWGSFEKWMRDKRTPKDVCGEATHSVEEFLPSFPNARGRITWRDMLCMTALKAGLPVAVRQLFSFIAVAVWGLRFSPWGLRFSPRGLRFSQRGLRFSQRGLRFTLVHGLLGLRSSF